MFMKISTWSTRACCRGVLFLLALEANNAFLAPRPRAQQRVTQQAAPEQVADEATYTLPWRRKRPVSIDDPDGEDSVWIGTEGKAEHAVVMMRHGESLFNRHGVFTGWCDVPLTETGRAEATRAGEVLAGRGLELDVCFCSVLQRSSVSAYLMLEGAGQSFVDVRPRWELNERHYGDLQGLNKAEVAAQMAREGGEDGAALCESWRQGYHARPPPMRADHPHAPLLSGDRRYAGLVEGGTLPATESLADTAERVMELWAREVAPLVRQGKRVAIVAHRNSLRALIRNLEGLTDAQVAALDIPTGAPFVYPLTGGHADDASAAGGAGFLRPRAQVAPAAGLALTEPQAEGKGSSSAPGFQGVFLEDDGCTDGFVAARAACVASLDRNPAVPPEECLLDYGNMECSVEHLY